MEDVSINHRHLYPVSPRGASSSGGTPSNASLSLVDASGEALSGAYDVSPHIGRRCPKFLTQARVHFARRQDDTHARLALEGAVDQTKKELEALACKREAEVKAWHEEASTRDVKQEDVLEARARVQQSYAVDLASQMEESQLQLMAERARSISEHAGYFGPEEKNFNGAEANRRQADMLLKQMQVNQERRLDSRKRRLCQERKLIDNSEAHLSEERIREKDKLRRERRVLVTTLKSQQRIANAKNLVDQIDR